MYQILAIDIPKTIASNLSGIITNWVRHSNSLQAAKEYCEKALGEEISWNVTNDGIIHSMDLVKVAYHISKIVPIDEGR